MEAARSTVLAEKGNRMLLAELMNRLGMVIWDRFTVQDGEDAGTVFGWIPRPDGRSDFVLLQWLFDDGVEVGFATSSAEYSARIGELLHGPGRPHFPCLRVDEHFGDLVDSKTAPRATSKPKPDGGAFHG